MSSNWIRTALKYALILAPTAFLAALVALVWFGHAISSLIHEPSQFHDSPVLVRKFARIVYGYTLTHWQTVPECAQFDRQLLYRPRPGRCRFENAEFRTTMNFDAAGARLTPAPANPAAAAKPRLVILGDSHAMGWGVEDGETFASFLATDFGHPTVNLGVSSYATPRELLRLRHDRVLSVGDIVVIQYCDNDARENHYYATHGKVGPYEPSEFQRMLDQHPLKVATLPIAGVVLRHTWKSVTASPEGRDTTGADAADPTDSLLAVLRAFPELKSHRVLIVAINGRGASTHLDAVRIAAAGHDLIVPTVAAEDYLELDDHMRPAGHRKTAASIATALADNPPPALAANGISAN